ncbi:MAG: glucosyltransferase domain-containing protein [Alcaligenes sp.]
MNAAAAHTIGLRATLLPATGGRRVLLACIVVATLTVLARLPFVLTPGMSTDSYAYLDGWPTLAQLAGQGRFGQFLVFRLLEALAVDPLAFATLLQGVGLALFAFTMPLMFSAFSTAQQNRLIPLCLAALVVTLHPFSAEILTFSEASFTALLATSMGVLAVFLLAKRPRWWWLAGIMLIAALSMYQLLINFVGLMILFGFLQTYLRVGNVRRHVWAEYRPLLNTVMVMAGALVVYLIAHKALVMSLGIQEVGRAGFLPLAKVGGRMQEVAGLGGFLWNRPLLVTYGPAAKFLLWALALTGWVFLVVRLLARPRADAALPIVAMLLVPVAAIGVVAVGAVWWPAPRILGGVVAAWAMGIYWLAWLADGRLGRVLICSAGGALLLAFSAVGHRVHSDQIQLNAFDRLLAQRVYTELTHVDGFTDQTAVVVVNRRLSWSHPLPLATAWMDLNLTAFADKRAIKGLLQLSNGRTLNVVPALPADIKACESLPAWPDIGFATARSSGDVLVCI